MGLSITSKDYKDVRVATHTDMPSGVVTCKTFTIKQNRTNVIDRITIMCFKHDLKCTNVSSVAGETMIACSIKCFDNIRDFIYYIQNKAIKTKYSFKIRGEFALAKIGDKEYIYRIKSKNLKS